MLRSLMLKSTAILQENGRWAYWGKDDKRIKLAAEKWLPEDINAIPLRVWDPNDSQPLMYQEGLLEAPPLILETGTVPAAGEVKAVPAGGEASVPA